MSEHMKLLNGLSEIEKHRLVLELVEDYKLNDSCTILYICQLCFRKNSAGRGEFLSNFYNCNRCDAFYCDDCVQNHGLHIDDFDEITNCVVHQSVAAVDD